MRCLSRRKSPHVVPFVQNRSALNNPTVFGTSIVPILFRCLTLPLSQLTLCAFCASWRPPCPHRVWGTDSRTMLRSILRGRPRRRPSSSNSCACRKNQTRTRRRQGYGGGNEDERGGRE